METTTRQRKNKPLDEQIGNRKRVNRVLDSEDFISTGSTLLNLAMTDDPRKGYQCGKMVNLIGDSSSGKTLMALTALAEVCYGDAPHRGVLDDVENACEFDMSYMFGEGMNDFVEAPGYEEDGDSRPSNFIEDFHDYLLTWLEGGDPFFYVLDSFDALDAIDDNKKIEEQRTARAKGKDTSGSYRMAKPKKASEILRNVCGTLKKGNSILLIISQTRDNIDPMSFEKKTRSGGRALKFYATHEIWAAVGKAIKKLDRPVGHEVTVKVTKNKVTGKKRVVKLSVYNDYGIDDIGSCIDWLVSEKFWAGGGSKKIDPGDDLDVKPALRASLIKQIEDGGLEEELRDLVGDYWNEIEEKLKLKRKPRYGR